MSNSKNLPKSSETMVGIPTGKPEMSLRETGYVISEIQEEQQKGDQEYVKLRKECRDEIILELYGLTLEQARAQRISARYKDESFEG